jgi:branched-chain amino acid transport system permease protein
VAVGVSLAVQYSRFGEALVAVREDPVAAAAAGIDVRRRKLQAYCLSAAVTAAAGALYASVLYVITPDSVFGLLVSVQALIIPIVGGRGTVWGPVLGAVLLVTLAEQLNANLGSTMPGINGLMFGAALVLLVLLAREGLIWRAKDVVSRLRPLKPTPAGTAAVTAPELAVLDHAADPAGPDRAVLEVTGIRRSFNGVRVLEDVSFAVRPGEVVGIIGPNGAGKTTLINIVNGLVTPDGGTVRFSGRDVTRLPAHARARLGMGRTFQVTRPLQRCTVDRNVRISTLGDRRGAQTASRALRAVGLHPRAAVGASDLDVGELRRLELARALAGRPAVLLVDEILAGLSSDQVDDIVDLLRAIADHGVAVVIIEHTMSAMLRLADRLIMLDAGTVITSGRPGDVVNDRRVVEAYLGSKWSSNA